MFETELQPLLESGILTQDTLDIISQALSQKLAEAREEMKQELKEEFAAKYQFDQEKIVSALDKMMAENLSNEINAFQQERKQFEQHNLKAKLQLKENARKFNSFLMTKLAEEIKEFRKSHKETIAEQKASLARVTQKVVLESMKRELTEFQTSKKQFASEQKALKAKLKESATKFDQFVFKKLAEEISEFKDQKQQLAERQNKLESFVVESLSNEIKDFAQDKKALVEARVKLVAEGRQRIKALEQKFIKESAQKLKQTIPVQLNAELTSLKEDIQSAKRNQFGRKIFESFMSEFASSYVSKNEVARKLAAKLATTKQQLAESKRIASQVKQLAESKAHEVRKLKQKNLREQTMAALLKPLNREKAQVMSDLLESVETPNLKTAFDKYLPVVLEQQSTKTATKSTVSSGVSKQYGQRRSVIAEKRKTIVEQTGDKPDMRINKIVESNDMDDSDLQDIQRLTSGLLSKS